MNTNCKVEADVPGDLCCSVENLIAPSVIQSLVYSSAAIAIDVLLSYL